MADFLDAAALRQRLLKVCQRMVENEDALCQADRDLGDGDHGVTMARAFANARETLERTEPAPAADMNAIGRGLLSSGGTAGAIFGTLFLTLARQLGGATVDAPALAAAFKAAADAVQARGKAAPGNKTMIDALLPAVTAFSGAQDKGVHTALKAAAEAARAGAESTRSMTPKMGRARTMGERAVGFIDPGALSMALIFEALAEDP